MVPLLYKLYLQGVCALRRFMCRHKAGVVCVKTLAGWQNMPIPTPYPRYLILHRMKETKTTAFNITIEKTIKSMIWKRLKDSNRKKIFNDAMRFPGGDLFTTANKRLCEAGLTKISEENVQVSTLIAVWKCLEDSENNGPGLLHLINFHLND